MCSPLDTDAQPIESPWEIGSQAEADAGLDADGVPHGAREPVVRVAALEAAIAQLRELSKANASRSSQEALAANLVLLRKHGVDDEILDLVVEIVISQDVDEEVTAAINYLASGFLLALLAMQQELGRTRIDHLSGS